MKVLQVNTSQLAKLRKDELIEKNVEKTVKHTGEREKFIFFRAVMLDCDVYYHSHASL